MKEYLGDTSMKIRAFICCLPLLLGGCNATTKKDTNVVEQNTYVSYVRHDYIDYYFDYESGRCHISKTYYDTEIGTIPTTYTWIVYLSGCYPQEHYSSFVICKTKQGKCDYYLYYQK